MKKYCFLFVFLVAALSLRAQIVGDFAVTRKVLAERGGELHMVLEISVSRKAVTRSQSWTILPELSTPDRKSVKLFPHILINGRYQQHMQERRRFCDIFLPRHSEKITSDAQFHTITSGKS